MAPVKSAPLRRFTPPRLISLEQFLETCDWWGSRLVEANPSTGQDFTARFFREAALSGQPAKVGEVKEVLLKKLTGLSAYRRWLPALNASKTSEQFIRMAKFLGGDASAFDGLVQTFNGHSYLYWNEYLTFDEAKAIAVQLGGYLVTITSKEENDFLIQQTEAGVFRKDFKIGLERTGPGRMGWKWVTGEPLAYHNWVPDNGSSWDSAYFTQDKGQWIWVRASRTGWGQFIIEWDTPTPQPPKR